MSNSDTNILKLLPQKNTFAKMLNTTVLIFLLYIIEAVFTVFVSVRLAQAFKPCAYLSVLFSFCVLLFIVSYDIDSSSKLTWSIIIMLIPFAGAGFCLYSLYKVKAIEKKRQAARKKEGFPQYTGCYVEYFPCGKSLWQTILQEINNAQRYIFLEYFIVEEGDMWGSILSLLSEKAKSGVEVRLLYDGNCELTLLPHDYPERLSNLNIKCKVFSRYHPLFSVKYNFRDHRKIFIADGKIAFTGGINLADVYIDHDYSEGHWKDTAVSVKGKCVDSFVKMFLDMWNYDKPYYNEYSKYIVTHTVYSFCGITAPFGCDPFDGRKASVNSYLDILHGAKKYVHIMTPFLVPGEGLLNALKQTSNKGVEIIIIMSGVPDNKLMQIISETYYKELMECGVKIYRYTKGVIHAKMFICDDDTSIVGSINLDYRSLYHNYECGVYLHNCACIADIEADFQRTLQVSVLAKENDINGGKTSAKIMGATLRLISPLL